MRVGLVVAGPLWEELKRLVFKLTIWVGFAVALGRLGNTLLSQQSRWEDVLRLLTKFVVAYWGAFLRVGLFRRHFELALF